MAGLREVAAVRGVPAAAGAFLLSLLLRCTSRNRQSSILQDFRLVSSLLRQESGGAQVALVDMLLEEMRTTIA